MTTPARIYVDETYGDDRTYMIQAAISLPAGNAEQEFTRLLTERIASNPKFARTEFKGGSISPGNRDAFQWLLQQTVNLLATIGDGTPVRSVIAIDSIEKYRGDVYDSLYDTLKGSLADIGYPSTEIDEARDFIRQVIWLHSRLANLFPPAGAGGIEIYFDKKFRLDQKFEESVAAWVPRGSGRIRFVEKRWKAYTRLFRILFKTLPSSRPHPDVSKYTYIDSKSNPLIQAADLLSNLTLNALRFRMGVPGEKVRMKYDMLCAVCDGDPIDAGLLPSFVLSGDKVLCTDPNLFSSITLHS